MNVEALETAVAGLHRAVDEQEQEQDPSLEDLQAWARQLPAITHDLAVPAREMRQQVLQVDDRFVLRDDASVDQEERMINAADRLRSLNTLMEQANAAARQFQTGIDHVEFEAEAPPERQGRETRTSTAAMMARWDSASTNIDPEPSPLWPDKPLGRNPKP